jgi:putative ABC transport system permease protein
MSLLTLPFRLLLLLYTSALLALGQIWSNKVRAALTTTGIVIGIASVTAVIAALTGLKANVLAEFESIGTNKLFVYPYYAGPRINRMAMYQRIRFRVEHFNGMLTHCPSVHTFCRMSGFSRPLSYEGRLEDQVNMSGIESTWHEVENRAIVQGRPFSLVDTEQARAVCIINTKTVEKLGMPRDPIGHSLFVGDRRFRVVGVLEPRNDTGMFGQDSSGLECFIPLSTCLQMNPTNGVWVIGTSRSPDVSEEAQAEITAFMRRQRRLGPTEPNNFRVDAMQQYLTQFQTIATTTTVIASAVVGISLLVGGIGIMNIMLVSVSERTREIGLRKAVGARPSAILLQFLVEAVVLCLLGGAIGLLCGQGLTSLLAKIPGANLSRAAIPAWAVALSLGFSGSVGLLFGMFPALKAARLDPIDALRHE